MKKKTLSKIYQQLKNSNLFFDAGWRTFTFEFHDELFNEKKEPLDGETISDGVIKLAACSDEANSRITLLHEILHVIMDSVGLGGEHGSDNNLVTIPNENLVENLSKGLLTYRYLNPELFKLIFGETK